MEPEENNCEERKEDNREEPLWETKITTDKNNNTRKTMQLKKQTMTQQQK